MAKPSTPKPVRLLRAVTSETPNGEVIMRGVLDPSTMGNIKIDRYQREEKPLILLRKMIPAIQKGDVPDIIIGMRGEECSEGENNSFVLNDACYVIDGQQRLAASRVMMDDGDVPVLGATVYFFTTYEWERTQFNNLNVTHSRLSPNVILRNLGPDYPVADVMKRMTDDRSFILYKKVQWSQYASGTRKELISAMTYFTAAGTLHGHLGSGKSKDVIRLTQGLQAIYKKVGRNTFMANQREFYDTIEYCFGIEHINFKSIAIHVRQTFLQALAKVFSDHTNFWVGNRLEIPTEIKVKLKRFPISDVSVINLAKTGGSIPVATLAGLLRDHINRNRAARNRLVLRTDFLDIDESTESVVG